MPSIRKLNYPNSSTNSYNRVPHAQRLQLIHEYCTHQMRVKDLVPKYSLSFNTIRNIIVSYEQTGRTNRKRVSLKLLSANRQRQGRPERTPDLGRVELGSKQRANITLKFASPDPAIGAEEKIRSKEGAAFDSFPLYQLKLSPEGMVFEPLSWARAQEGSEVKILLEGSADPVREFNKTKSRRPLSNISLMITECFDSSRKSEQPSAQKLGLPKRGFAESGPGCQPKLDCEPKVTLISERTNDVIGSDLEIIASNLSVYRKEVDEQNDIFTGPLAALNRVVHEHGSCLKQAPAGRRASIRSILKDGTT